MGLAQRTAFVIALVVAIIGGAANFVAPMDQVFHGLRIAANPKPVSGQFVVVGIDQNDVDRLGSWPWSRRQQAALLDRIHAANPRAVFIDLPLYAPTNAADDKAVAKSIARFGRSVTLAARVDRDPVTRELKFQEPMFAAASRSNIAVSLAKANPWGLHWELPTRVTIGDKTFASLASAMAGEHPTAREFIVDHAFMPSTIPHVSASEILSPDFDARHLKGKTVLVALEMPEATAYVRIPRFGSTAPAYLHVLGAETLQGGAPINLGWLPLLMAVMAIIGGALLIKRKWWRRSGYGIAVLASTLLPWHSPHAKIDIAPSATLVALAVFGGMRVWHHWRYRLKTTGRTGGLPNFGHFEENAIGAGVDVVVAKVRRFDDALATLNPAERAVYTRQIARRIALSSSGRVVCHEEAGYFAWAMEGQRRVELTNHLDGLRGLFSSGIIVGDRTIDTNISFGIDQNWHHEPASRLRSAMAVANEAEIKALNWLFVEEQRLATSNWDVSLYANMDEGMRNGDIWVAYQPKVDIVSGDVKGAEALIRWTHPERGHIRPDQFILFAEQQNRIDDLTYWVLGQALAAAREFDRNIPGFEISVNLSAQLLNRADLVMRITDLVHASGLMTTQVTLEITETAKSGDMAAARSNLMALRAAGMKISIDDFGMGQSPLLYLSEMPNDEIKIDMTFVSNMVTNATNRHIVESTIDLAHRLDRIAVAEGIEDAPTLALLRSMGCDIAQGYHLGRPVNRAEFAQLYCQQRAVNHLRLVNQR
jgi:EAL domain-containing protein (putative c-di-GMP-specific phosphodiesterase class I)/CHASE2 domain-containing sensor protein